MPETPTDPECLADELERIRAAMDCYAAHRKHELYEGDCRSTDSHIEFAERAGHRAADLSAAACAIRSQAERIRALEAERDQWIRRADKTWHEAFAVRAERERCIGIINQYQVPVGNSPAGELAAELTMEALREIRDQILKP